MPERENVTQEKTIKQSKCLLKMLSYLHRALNTNCRFNICPLQTKMPTTSISIGAIKVDAAKIPAVENVAQIGAKTEVRLGAVAAAAVDVGGKWRSKSRRRRL